MNDSFNQSTFQERLIHKLPIVLWMWVHLDLCLDRCVSETVDHVDHNIELMVAAEAWGLGFIVGNFTHFIHSLWIISSSLVVFTSMQINSIFAVLSLNIFLNLSCISVPMYLGHVKDWTQFVPHLMNQDKVYVLLFGLKKRWFLYSEGK